MGSFQSILTRSPEETRRLGRILGGLLEKGDLVLLVGELGAGKTCLAQGIASGLGVPRPLSSPSFVLIKEYHEGRIPLFHLDFYRLAEEEIEELGVEEYLERGACVVEWAERGLFIFPPRYLLIELRILSQTERLLSFKPEGSRPRELLEELLRRWSSL